jgi:hypothetical protein
MHLPDDLPHTRHEQYLVALPDELLSHEETLIVIEVLRRVRRFYVARIWRHIVATLPPDRSETDVVLALAELIASEGRHRRWFRGPLVRRQEPA